MEGLLLHIISQDCSFLSVHGVQGSFPYFKGGCHGGFHIFWSKLS